MINTLSSYWINRALAYQTERCILARETKLNNKL